MADSGKASRWGSNGSGTPVPPELQSKFLDWLLADPDDKEFPSQRAWCEAHGITQRTVRTWKKDDRFKREWERRAAEKNVSPERMQDILDTLYRVAVNDGDVAAAKLYLDQANRLLPPKTVVQEEEFSGLSDEDLVSAIAEELNLG